MGIETNTRYRDIKTVGTAHLAFLASYHWMPVTPPSPVVTKMSLGIAKCPLMGWGCRVKSPQIGADD